MRRKTPEVLQAIIGTAGHVDHGKTELVRALTGCDTDRLPEEKARGMSIDLGFAPFVLSDGRIAGVVDVPGHRDFIRNMVAGAASMDVLLLAVAADDGIMPQTDEHMRIVRLLRTPRVMAVVTKADLVGDDAAERVREDVRRFIARGGYAESPVVLASNRTGQGLDEVRAVLEQLVREAAAAAGRVSTQPDAFRMNIERVLTVKGHGTVVTGIPLAGTVDVGERLELLPGGQVTGLRAIQTFRIEAARAGSCACCALNLRDVAAESIRRGMTLAAPGVFAAVSTMIGTLENASDALTIQRRQRVRLHAGTSVATASLSLIGAERLGPGERAFVHIKLEGPLALATGDRFLVRALTPPSTLGGGSVLTTRVPRSRRKSETLRASLEASREAVTQTDYFGAALAAGCDATVSHLELVRMTQCTTERAGQFIAIAQAKQSIISLGESWLVSARLGELETRVDFALRSYHRSNPEAWGMMPRQLCKLLGVNPQDVHRLVQELVRRVPGITLEHGCLAVAGHRPNLTESQLCSKEKMARRIEAAGMRPPARGDLQAALGLRPVEMNLLVRLLTQEGKVTGLHTHLMWAEDFERCRERVVELISKLGVVDVKAFRGATGTSRRVAVEVLELLDAQGLTRRVGDGRGLAHGASTCVSDGRVR
jgi:selenocysteine-specific elongation factor